MTKDEFLLKEILKALELYSEKNNKKLEQWKTNLESRMDQMKADLESRMDQMKADLESRMDQIKTELEDRMNAGFAQVEERLDRMEIKLEAMRVELNETQETVDFLSSKNLQHEKKLRSLFKEQSS